MDKLEALPIHSLDSRFQSDVFRPYLELLKAQYRFHPAFEHARKMWDRSLTAKELVNGPYLEKSQFYQVGDDIQTLSLHAKTISTIQLKLNGRSLYKHQTEAIKLILAGKNTAIATGTGSGKTLCYQIPILDDILRDPSPGLRAIIIYPLNALVNDQLEEWEKLLKSHSQITFARFTGQTPADQGKYEERLVSAIREQLIDSRLTQQELQREVRRRLTEHLRGDAPNRLNHRDAIRNRPPHVLVTNFSMLEYLLERPVDAPIFENSRLKFLVLDEAHAYRGIQATEIAFLIRRLKDRLGMEKLSCITTSATLGRREDAGSLQKVRKFASDLFREEFHEPNPIYGDLADPKLNHPAFKPKPDQYIKVIEAIRNNSPFHSFFGSEVPRKQINELLAHDENLYKLRKEILVRPTLLGEAAKKLWPDDPLAEPGLAAFLEIVSAARSEGSQDDILPTRLHYFVRAQDGLYVCLHKECPGRVDGKPAFFVSRKTKTSVPEGECSFCFPKIRSKIVEVVSCRKCGYLFGALQDLGPRNAQNPEGLDGTAKPYFNSFSTELGWAGDSFWSYFSVDNELPYPSQGEIDEEEDEDNLLLKPAELDWCVVCGKKKDKGEGDNCICEKPHLRTIKIFHRQCQSTKYENLFNPEKRLLSACPNCGARNGSGLEPLRRFQESDDETGLAMAIPLAHFQINANKASRKLLCFTDHRQRAAAFPSLLEEEAFSHDLGRKIVELINSPANHSKKMVDLSLELYQTTEHFINGAENPLYDPNFFLPVSRFPDDMPTDPREKGAIIKNLWIGEVMSYFGIADSSRESAEDLGLLAVRYQMDGHQKKGVHRLLAKYGLSERESETVFQIFLGFIRQRKAFTLPSGVRPDDPAFGRVTVDVAFVLEKQRIRNTYGWRPRTKKDGTYNDNYVTSYLKKIIQASSQEIYDLAGKIWELMTTGDILISNRNPGGWKLDHERLLVELMHVRYVCNSCGIVTTYSVHDKCLRKSCDGKLEQKPFNSDSENIIARWVSGKCIPKFTVLKSEEHTAQINKDLAKQIEDDFRADGINLLSSTTTFEMGINIGDLQKVLLRNAPPTSANYVQRVGRAGRGKDRNSVCVTLCRRTKYDADAWFDPPRLMSGEVRTPAIFTENKVVAQRHFNAVLFSKFLKEKIAHERALEEVRQKTNLEVFLPLDSREGIPENWFKTQPTGIFLDFLTWLKSQLEDGTFKTSSGRSLLAGLFDYGNAKEETDRKYRDILEEISGELKELTNERGRLYKAGEQISDIEQAIKDILGSDIINVLAKEGFLPRYAFPIDTVSLETGRSRWSRDGDVELTRDRGIAIAEFAPGAQVIAHKKVFTSAGLYIASKTDVPRQRFYSKCKNCGQIRISRTESQDDLKGNCSVCQKPIIATQDIRPYIEPLSFSVRYDPKGDGIVRYRRSTFIRQRQTLTHFIDSIEDSLFTNRGAFRIALKPDGSLFRYNLGPKNEGFMLCPKCGCSQPLIEYKPGSKHKRLRVFGKTMTCDNLAPWTKRLAYGHRFQSFCLIIRPISPPKSTKSLAFALQRGLSNLLDLESSDIGVSWRHLTNRTERDGVEIILYDNTPGGAGFVKDGFTLWEDVVKRSLDLCKSCDCENACYDCLKTYSNQSYHEDLNRNSVISFLS